MRRVITLAVTAGALIAPAASPARPLSSKSSKPVELDRSAAGVRPPRSPQPQPAAVSPTLQAIAACESGGDPTAVDASGTYRGKYQFDLQTWASVGGAGDPAAASEAEQDRRAQILLSQRGTAPWPVCG